MRSIVLAGLLSLFSASAHAGKLFTFLEGQVVERGKDHVVIATLEGTYWIDSKRPLNWLRKLAGKERISFWIRVDQIQRFRPINPSLKY